MANELALFESEEGLVKLDTLMRDDTIWINRKQMAKLFDRDVKTIGNLGLYQRNAGA